MLKEFQKYLVINFYLIFLHAQIIEYCDKRFASNEDEGTSKVEELVQLVVEVLPPPPKFKDEEEASNPEKQQI